MQRKPERSGAFLEQRESDPHACGFLTFVHSRKRFREESNPGRWEVQQFLPRNCLSSCRSVTQSCPTLCDPMDCSTPGFPVLHPISQSFLKLTSIESVMPSNRLVLCHPLLLLPSIFPSIRVFYHLGN